MEGNRNDSLRAILVVLFCCIAWPLLADNPEPFSLVILEQEPVPGTSSTPASTVIRVKFEDAANQIQKEKILLELDRVDITALAQFAEHVLTYQPPAPLQPGTHEIKISGTTADGRKIQEVNWNFTVPENPTPRSWQLGIEPSVSFEYKLRKDSPIPDRHRFSSNISINSQSTGRIQTNFVSTLQAQDPLPGAVPNEFDLLTYKADFTTAQSLLSVGDVVVNYDALSVANLARRGIFYQQKLPFLSSGFDLSFVRSEQIIGFKNGLGVSDSEQRVDAVSFFLSPLKKQENLGLRFYYLRGENAKEQGFNFGGVTRGSKGDAFGVSLNSSLFSNQFRLETFAARSDFDFNASDTFSGNKDHALLVRAVYDPSPRTWMNRASKVTVQLEAQDLGLFFKSLGNPFFVSDRRGLNLNSTWTLGIYGLTGGFSDFHDNVKGSSLLPTVDNTAYSAGFSVNPLGTTGPPRWPSLNVLVSRSEQESSGEAVSFLAVHSIVDNITSTATLVRTKWNMSLSTSYAKNNDVTDRVPDSDTKTLGLTASILPAPFWLLGTSLNFTRQGNRVTRIDTDLWTYSVTAGIPIQPERFAFDGQFSLFTTESSDQLNKSSNFSGTAQLSYQLHSLLKTKGRQTLALRLSYNRAIIEAPFINRQKGFEIFALLDFGWPFSLR